MNVHRLCFANLYGQARESLTWLLDQLSLDEPPSAEQLVVGENMLMNAQGAMIEANKQSLEVAELNPDIASELMNADATETSSFNRIETKILIKVNRFKSLYPHLSPAPVHAPGTNGAATVNKAGSFKLEKRRLPKFGGTLREYPTFKKNWLTQVAPNYDNQIQLYELRELVPVKVKVHVEKFSTIAEFWNFMDLEFRDKNELVRDRLAYLRNYSHPEDCRSDAQKFQGMYTRFHEVYRQRYGESRQPAPDGAPHLHSGVHEAVAH